MKWSRRDVVSRAAAVACLPGAVHAAGAPTLRLWINGDKGWRGIAHAAAAFTRDTGVAVQVEHPEDAISKFEQAAAAGKGPDVWIWPHDRLGSWAAAGLIAPVTPSRATRAAIDDQAWSAWQLYERTWGFPLGMETVALIYNKALTPTAPTSWDEVIALDQRLARQGKRALRWWMTEVYYSYGLISAGGGYAFGRRADGSYDPRDIGINTPGAVRGVETLLDLVRRGLLPRSVTYADAEAAINEGRVAMTFNGPWAWGNLRKSGIDFGVAPYPRIGGRPGGSFVGVLGAMVSSAGRQRELAHEFIESYLLALPSLRAIDADVPLGVPASKALYAERSADPLIAGSMAAVRAGTLMPSNPEMTRFWTAMAAALQNILQGREDVASGLARAAARIGGPA
ncbi:maltose/maltodextrin ABC transporter substrate-binding protein MalE [Aquabacterium sp.]|uniref:maltose/maltodextrin ABC transporter substrate-binding protein MalE n=1 Tax=Aquabacterium sp. TaxID=1872578 RepID=UPI002C41EE09|nr:maltose/maltodextrin ABC transporter substrate-binding protein MalE [Aquabacterium sp.]HSW04386.1 maltose/maltodextrin ABC transporter substrate-binding protein MalE [Aquabacterium sp.]